MSGLVGEWHEVDPWHWKSDGGYYVCRCRVRGRWRFEAWPPAPPRAERAPGAPGRLGWYPTPLGGWWSKAPAFKACRDHAAGREVAA